MDVRKVPQRPCSRAVITYNSLLIAHDVLEQLGRAPLHPSKTIPTVYSTVCVEYFTSQPCSRVYSRFKRPILVHVLLKIAKLQPYYCASQLIATLHIARTRGASSLGHQKNALFPSKSLNLSTRAIWS
ncbi:hypothetical protein PM082_014819 [Marasmius tenuissimus]|nr:hypothetical protein PM082_014819 [Marasmius tenuissimus]